MRGLWRLKQWRKSVAERLQLFVAERRIARFDGNAPSAARHHGLEVPLVLSLTSYPPRFPALVKTVKSLLLQNTRPDRTVLWIAHEDMPTVPDELRSLESCGFEIRCCADLRSYKKLLPALDAFPGAAIVTADDDVYYDPSWLGALVDAAKASPGCVVAHRMHMALFSSDGRFRPYDEWEMATSEVDDRPPDGRLFPTGVGGVFYPPDCFDPRVADSALAMKICPNADDIWFFWMAELKGTPHRCPQHPIRVSAPWKGSQDVALFQKNWLDRGNDRQIAAMEKTFGRIPAIFGDRNENAAEIALQSN
jgi:hypothetical protein